MKININNFNVKFKSDIEFKLGFIGLNYVDRFIGYNPIDRFIGLNPIDRFIGLNPIDRFIDLNPIDRFIGLNPIDRFNLTDHSKITRISSISSVPNTYYLKG